MRTQQIISGMNNSQKIRFMIDGFGILVRTALRFFLHYNICNATVTCARVWVVKISQLVMELVAHSRVSPTMYK